MNFAIIMYIWGIVQTVAYFFTNDLYLGITGNIWIVGGIIYSKLEKNEKIEKIEITTV
jgi:hypothetical protein